MKTDYNNLTSYEVCIILVAAVGVVLIGIQMYMTLPRQTQAAVVESFAMFDLHQQFAQAGDKAKFVMDTTQTFFDDFNLAFVETFSYPDQIGTPLIHIAQAVSNYSDSVALSYQQNNTNSNQHLGEVLGAYIVKTDDTTQDFVDTVSSEPKHFYKTYYYHAPQMVNSIFK